MKSSFIYYILLIGLLNNIVKSSNLNIFNNNFRDELAIKMCKAKLAYIDELVLHSQNQHIVFTCNRDDMESLFFETDNIFNITYTGYDIFSYISYNRNNKMIDIVFRGTKFYNIYNWIENLSFLKINPYKNTTECPLCDSIAVHRGFYSAYSNLKYFLIRALINIQIECPECTNIQFIGHSMGGALASLASFDLYHNLTDYKTIGLYTFGAPRVGNELYASMLNNYNINKLRVVNKKDLVPHILPRSIGYHHNKIEIWINDEYDDNEKRYIEKIKVCDGLLSKGSPGEDLTCSNSLKFPQSIYDHKTYFNLTDIEI